MSDDVERTLSEPASRPDPDAWATACEEDLKAEKARRRAQYGPPPTNAAEELRRLADAVTEKVAGLSKPLGGAMASAAAQGVAQQLIAQAKASIEPVVARNPQLFDHLAAAGNELLAAYRSAVHDAERRWTSEGTGGTDPRDEHVELDEPADVPDDRAALDKRLDERVELDDADHADHADDAAAGTDGADGKDARDASDDPRDDSV
ncbi:hypothetical protein GCM10009801_35570 [Streptomyces albiaxialis]|uniref:DUF5304 domain-containing protein n=1 Tax=Streptomyces albiaxialis TaxID=329523 RepID=A0ABP5HIZ3_9ACTN